MHHFFFGRNKESCLAAERQHVQEGKFKGMQFIKNKSFKKVLKICLLVMKSFLFLPFF